MPLAAPRQEAEASVPLPRSSPLTGRNKKLNRPNRTEPNHLISEPAETGRRTEPNRTEPSQNASKKRRPYRTEPENNICQTEPNRNGDFERNTEPKRIEPNRILPDITWCASIRRVGRLCTAAQGLIITISIPNNNRVIKLDYINHILLNYNIKYQFVS